VSSSDPSKKLAALLKRLRGRFPAQEEPEQAFQPAWSEPLVDELIYSFLLWEATSAQARNAFKRLKDSYIDYNELRVSLPGETAHVLGERYPRGEERAARLRASLFDLYKREFTVTLKGLSDGGKRDSRAYLESLEGIPGYVVDRLMQSSFQAHAVPLDERLRDLLADEGVVESEMSVDDAASWLSRQIKSEECTATCTLLRAWADEDAPEPRKTKAASAAPAKAESPAEEPRKGKSKGESRSESRSESKSEDKTKRRAATRKKVGKSGEA
jgi:hypothetical protein